MSDVILGLHKALGELSDYKMEQAEILSLRPDSPEKNRIVDNIYDVQLAMARIQRIINRCS